MSKARKNFYDAPRGKNKGVLYWGKSTYTTLVSFDGTQPYYTYQGVGSLTGGSTQSVIQG